MKFDIPVGHRTIYPHPNDVNGAKKKPAVLTKPERRNCGTPLGTKPMQRSYTYPTTNKVLLSRKKLNKPTNDDRNENLERFTTNSVSLDGDTHQLLPALDEMNVEKGEVTTDENKNNNSNDLYRLDEASNLENRKACMENLELDFKEAGNNNPIHITEQNGNYYKDMSEECQDDDSNIGTENGTYKMKRTYSNMATLVTVDNGNNKYDEADLTIREKKRKRLEVQTQPKSVNTLTRSNKAFPKPQEVIEAITRKFQDDVPNDFSEDFVFIITGSYYSAHLWRQHCIKTNNVKDLDLLSFGDIDIFYSQPYQPKRSEILDQNTQKDSAAPGFMECYYRNLEINNFVYEINYIRRVDLSITGGYFQLRDFIQNHIDINLVQAGAMVRLCGKGFDMTDEYSSEAFEKFLDDPQHIVAIPDIANTDSPGNSLIRVLTKATKFKLPYQLPARNQLLKVDFSKRPLVPKFMKGLWALPRPLQMEILDNFDLSDTWSGGRKLTTFSLKLQKKQTRMVWNAEGDNFELFYE